MVDLCLFFLSLQGNDPTALSVLTQAITGQVGFMDAEFCTTCGEKGAEKRCSICKMVSVRAKTDCQFHLNSEPCCCFFVLILGEDISIIFSESPNLTLTDCLDCSPMLI